MAAAISLRTYLLVSRASETVTIDFRDIGLHHTWKLNDLPWQHFALAQSSAPGAVQDDLAHIKVEPELIELMKPQIAQVSTHVSTHQRKIHLAAATTFLYLYLSLGQGNVAGNIFTLRSTIPIGAGLGSSASISVCLATALLLQRNTLGMPDPKHTAEQSHEQLELINRWAFVGEVLMHGNPSGVDNTVSTHGKAVMFQRNVSGQVPSVAHMPAFPELPLLLVDSKQAKSTAAEVAKVATLKQAQPGVVDAVLQTIGRVTTDAHALVSDPTFDPMNGDKMTRLGQLVALNHGLLYSLGVSHPRLELLKQLVDASGVGWTKLTGSGGGGCAFALLSPRNLLSSGSGHEDASGMDVIKNANIAKGAIENDTKTLTDLEATLQAQDFEIYKVVLGGHGVGVLSALSTHGHNTNGFTATSEIHQSSFGAAQNADELEALVSYGRNWQYWTS